MAGEAGEAGKGYGRARVGLGARTKARGLG